MSVIRAIVAHHFTIYLTLLALVGATAVLNILLEYSLLRSLGYGSLMVSGFWVSQGLAGLINRAMGYGGKSQSGSFD